MNLKVEFLFKKDLYYEVKRAFNNVERAQKQVPASKIEVEQALENFKIVEEGYKSNSLDYISLQKAEDDYINSLNTYIESVYNYNIALIQVEMAMHYHLIDIHHKSEHAVHYHFDCDEKEVRHRKVNK